jgi:hypothetical protein
VGSYYYCMQGSMTCTAGQWSECQGSRVQRVSVPSETPTRLMALGTSQACGASGVCNPYCNQVEDNAQGLTIDPADDVTLADDGVTLKQVEGGSVGTTCDSLTITPGTGTLDITQLSPLSPSSIQFTAAVNPPGCYPGQVEVLWAIDRFDVATMSSTGLVTMISPVAGAIQVTAYAGSLTASAVLNVTLSVLNVASAPAGTGALFTSTTGSYADAGLVALYPYANTVFPLGLGAPLIQWRDTASLTAGAVKISLRYPATGTPTFQWSQIVPGTNAIWLNPPTNTIPLAAGPRATIPESVWDAFESVAKGGTGAYVIQRLTTHASAPVNRLRQELVTPIKFATGQLKGTVYYQSYGTNLIRNYGSTYSPQTYGANAQFGAATLAIQPGASYPTVAAGFSSGSAAAPTSDASGCRVCHTASANGSTLVTNLFSNRDSLRVLLGVDSASGGSKFLAPNAPSPNNGIYAWPAIYPDGSLLFNNAGPPQEYASTAPPGGLEGSAGDVPNRLYSLSTNQGLNVTPAATATYLNTLRAATPTFSPVGNRLAFNHYGGKVSTSATTGDKRSLAIMDYASSTKTFTNFRRLVTESTSACSTLYGTTEPCTNVWPSFMPANAGVVYEHEIFNNGSVVGATSKDFGGTRAGCSNGASACSNEGTRAELWWVSLDSTPTAKRLNNANGLNGSNVLTLPLGDSAGSNGVAAHTANNEGVLNYEPTVSPEAVGGYYWVAFTSRRLYGNVATVNPWWSDPRYKALGGSLGPTTKKIWVAAVAENPAEGTDPSSPAFYLPGQEYLAGNSKAYWVLEACHAASSTRSTATECESDLDCCGAPTTSVCSLQTPVATPAKRHCVPRDATVCIADASPTQCFSDAQCCGFATGSRCANGTCQVPPTLSLYQPGTFTRDFESDCASGKRPVWQFFEWQAELPLDTSIAFAAATSSSTAGLATATSVEAGYAVPPDTTTWTNDGTNINDQLSAQNLFSEKYLRVTASLMPSADELSAPVLQNWRVVYDCVDNE